MPSPTLLGRLATAEARAHARFAARSGGAQPFGPLMAVFAGAASPLSTAWHDGTRPPAPQEWQACEDFFAARGQGCTVHLLSDAAPGLLPVLAARGYALTTVLHVHVHDLQELPPAPALQVSEEADAHAWAALSGQGFGPGSAEVMQQVGEAGGTRRFVAWLGGEPAATAAFAVQDGVAAFHGTSTRPEYRGQGLQAALLAHRLRLAGDAGADLASVFVTPASGSERNVVRAGFRLAGMRLTFTRPPGQ